MSKYRIAMGALTAWTAFMLVAAAGVASTDLGLPADWVAYQSLGAVAGAFVVWSIGLQVITCITIVVRLGHLRPRT
jgi:hypothetical protein